MKYGSILLLKMCFDKLNLTQLWKKIRGKRKRGKRGSPGNSYFLPRHLLRASASQDFEVSLSVAKPNSCTYLFQERFCF